MAEKAPDPSKRSFAPTEDELKKQQSTTEQVKEIPSAEVSLHMMSGKLDAILEEMKTLNNLFKYTKSIMGQKPDTTVALPQSPPATTLAQAPAPTPEISPRVKEILMALEPVKDLLRIDVEESTMMIMVRPAQFLGSDNFSKVAAIVRSLGGQYVSAGKNSHFEVPKAPRKA